MPVHVGIMQRAGEKTLRGLGCLARALSTSATVASVPAVAPTHAVGKSLPAMDVPMPGVDLVAPAPVSPSEPPTEQATLANGVQIASMNTMAPMATVSILVNGGSQMENSQFEGASQLLEAMAFRGTTKRTHFATVRQAENYGITLSAYAGRENIAYYATAPRDSVAPAFELLAESVRHPLFIDTALSECRSELSSRNAKALKDPITLAAESLPTAALTGGLARPKLYAGAPISAEMLHGFHNSVHTPSAIMVAASGIAQPTLESLTQEFLGDMVAGPDAAAAPPISRYVGSSTALHNPSTATALIAFECSGWRDTERAIATTVLQYVLGGGQDFSSGGPGKGMHSALYRNVLCKNSWVRAAFAHMDVFDDLGMFGVLISSAQPEAARALVDILCRELEKVTSHVTADEVERAKNACLASVVSALESPMIVAEDIGRQIICHGRRMPLEEFKSILQGVTEGTVKRTATSLLSGKASAVLIGDQSIMPKFSEIEARFK